MLFIVSLAAESERGESNTNLFPPPVRVHGGESVSVLLWFLIKPPKRKFLSLFGELWDSEGSSLIKCSKSS